MDQESLKSMLSYSPCSGQFVWLPKVCCSRSSDRYCRAWNKRYAGTRAGYHRTDNNYVSISIHKKNYYAHRLAWLYVHGQWPENEIDHINGIRWDNRIENLRPATRTQNSLNTSVQRNSTSGLKGAYIEKRSGRWRSYIRANKTVYLGLFDTAEQAHEAYCEAAKIYHGQFARI